MCQPRAVMIEMIKVSKAPPFGLLNKGLWFCKIITKQQWSDTLWACGLMGESNYPTYQNEWNN